MRRIILLLVALLSVGPPLLGMEESRSPSSADAPVLQRFLSRQDEPPAGYRALRRIEARNHRFNLHGWVEAATEVTTDGRFTFQVVRQGGSEYIIKKALRPLLENEQRLFATGDAARSAVTAQNYDLRGSEAAEPGVVKLLVKPKRRDVSLIDGALFVTEEDADLVRVEGTLAKNPSFWTKRVDVVRHYSRIGGVRVPTRLDSTAQIRFAGTATLSMTWEYESINGESVTPRSTLRRPQSALRSPRITE